MTAHLHWESDFTRAAASGGVDLSLQAAVAAVNGWIADIDAASERPLTDVPRE